MKTNFKISTKTLFVLIAMVSLYAFAPIDKGFEIAKKADELSNGWKTSSSDMIMTLTNKNGQKTVRKMHSYTMEVEGDGDKIMTIFDTPIDVKGTATMTFSHKSGDDEQWLYLPSIKRVKRISSSNKSGPFMGSEFAFEDISSAELEKFTYKYISDEKANNVDCFIVERYPVSKSSGYKRNKVWYNKSNYRIEKIEYYDIKNTLLKTLTFSEYKLYLTNYWFAHKLNMVNEQNGKKSSIEFKNVKFGINLTDDDFSQNALKRTK